MRIKSICKNNKYFCDKIGAYTSFDNLLIGECYEFTLEEIDMMYNLLVDGKEKYRDGYVFFGIQPAFERYEFNRFFYSKEEMLDIRLNSILSAYQI